MCEGPYKVVELTEVTDKEIEETLNVWTAKGYRFDAIHFVTREGFRRPSMAFMVFTKEDTYMEG